MKTLFKTCIFLSFITTSIGWCNAQSRTFEVDGINYRVVKDPDGSMATGTVSICPLEYGEYSGDIVIPNVVKERNDQYADKYRVVSVDEEAFAQTKYLKSVKLPPSIETIGDNAFRLSSIEKIELPMGNLTILGKSVFAQTQLVSIEIPSTIKVIGEYAFYYCNKLSEVILHEGLNTIEGGAFYSCNKLESIVLPNTLKSIGEGVFNSCYMLSNVKIGSELKNIGDKAFYGCIRLRNVELPEGLREIGNEAFYNSGVVELTIPKSIKVIKERCFANSMLRRIALPSTLIAIEDYAFFGCLLDTLNYSANTLVASNALMSQAKMMEMMGFSKTEETFRIPEGGKELDVLLSKLEKKATKYKKLSVDYDKVVFSQSGIKINELEYTPVSYPIKGEVYGTLVLTSGASASGHVTIPEVIEIVGGPYTEKYIVSGIASGAFDGIKGVTSISLPATMSTFGIAASAFRGTGITEFVLPDEMDVIPAGLLHESNLSKITLPKNTKKIEPYSFSGTSLKEIVIPEGASIIGKNAFANCKQLSKVIIPSTVKVIDDEAFFGCPITEIVLPDSIEEVGYRCFYECQLVNLKLPKGLKKIGIAAFKCDNLVDVEICGNPCDWTVYKDNHLFGRNPQLKIHIKDAKYAVCLKQYSSNLALDKQNAGQKETPLSDFVDLGLTSGTLWATCNVGAEAPEDYGDYYAWGETIGLKDGKKVYDARTHQYLDVQGQNLYMKKYCLNDYRGEVDSLYSLLPEDDVATVKLGEKWRMPTKDEMIELVKECQWIWLSYSNNVSGYLVTGPNGNSIFLPAAGYYNKNNNIGLNSSLYYWTNEQNLQGSLILSDFIIVNNSIEQLNINPKWTGCSVRAVKVK